VGAWLAVGLRSARLQDDADKVLPQVKRGPVATEVIDSALSEYSKAERLSPDQTPLIKSGQLLWAAGRKDDARAAARKATEAEPDNLQAWELSYLVADPKSPARRHAKAELLRLNPWFLYVLTRRSPT
jgi:tetratricopeptide (TPR) repeat protein